MYIIEFEYGKETSRRLPFALDTGILIDVFYIVYLDDILIFSKSEEDYYKYLKYVVKCFQRAGLYTNPKKYDFF